MSKQNKVNKTNYVQSGRLTPDDMARERKRQGTGSPQARGTERVTGKARPEGGGRGASRPRSAPEE
jgi:hypothetical protein